MSSRTLGLLGVCLFTAACGGGSDDPVCPPGFPVERDGMCYAAEDAGDGGDASRDARADGSDTEDASERDAQEPPADTGNDDAGDDDDDDSDAGSGDAGIDGGDAAVECMPEHPEFTESRRWCEAPGCYCRASDSCHSLETAEACCDGNVICVDDEGEEAGCFGVHPIVSSTGRTCEPGNCFCADPDACFPAATASTCCDVAVTCFE